MHFAVVGVLANNTVRVVYKAKLTDFYSKVRGKRVVGEDANNGKK